MYFKPLIIILSNSVTLIIFIAVLKFYIKLITIQGGEEGVPITNHVLTFYTHITTNKLGLSRSMLEVKFVHHGSFSIFHKSRGDF